jgi:hypothetical protein
VIEVLTELEKARLIDSKHTKTGAERYTDHVVRRKLKGWLSEADEVELILNHMNYKNLGKIITPDVFLSLARISETALGVSGIPTFTGRDTVIVGSGPKGSIQLKKGESTAPIPGVSEGLFTVRRATDEEKAQVDQLKIHILNLMLRLGKDDLQDVIEEAEELLKVS